MVANNVLTVLIKIVNIPLNLLAIPTTFVGGLILAIPFIGFAVSLLIFAVWFPLLGIMLAAAWFWHYAPSGVRSLAVLVGVPAAFLGDCFLRVTPGAAMGDDLSYKYSRQV